MDSFYKTDKNKPKRQSKKMSALDWDTVYRSSFLCTKVSKLIVFQFNLLHRRLATNSFLTKINLKDNEPLSAGLGTDPLFFGKILSNGQLIVENFQTLLT